MKRVVLLVLAGYLAVGVLFGLAAQPQQLWSCDEADAAYGELLYADQRGGDCTGSVTLRERATTVAVGSALWLPLVIASGLSS